MRGDEPSCACVPSQRGVYCLECSFSGYLDSSSQCVCYGRDQDPNYFPAPCTPIVQTSKTIATTKISTQSTCDCFFSRTKGMYRSLVEPNTTKMGDPSPPVCDACFSDGIGPLPGTVVDVVAQHAPLVCTQYGGPDPALVLAAVNATGLTLTDARKWTSCSGHGAWDDATHRCLCNAQWTIRPSPNAGFTGETAATCDSCAPQWGPPAQCLVPWVLDPLTGEAAECGGHGSWSPQDRVCACFGNSTAGNWQLATVPAPATVWVFSEPDGSKLTDITITSYQQACTACVSGFDRDSGCTVLSV